MTKWMAKSCPECKGTNAKVVETVGYYGVQVRVSFMGGFARIRHTQTTQDELDQFT